MIQFSKSVVINRPVEDVFDYSVDPANTPAWMDDTPEHTHNGEMEVGSTGVRFVKFMGLKLGGNYEITTFYRPSKYCFKAITGPLQADVCQSYEEVGGGTRFTYAVELEGRGLYKVLEWLINMEGTSTLEKELKKLKGILEVRSAISNETER